MADQYDAYGNPIRHGAPANTKTSGGDGQTPLFSEFIDKGQGTPTPSRSEPGPPKMGNPLTTSLLQYTGGTSTQRYEDIARRILPASIQKGKGGSWMGRFAVALGEAGPEVLDFATSPAGMALIAAHMFPATAPIAGIIDFGLGGMGMVQSIPQVGKAISDGTPESWADAIKGITFSLGMMKGGAKSLVASTAKYRVAPFDERMATRESIIKAPDEQKIPMLEKAKAASPPPKGLQKLYDEPRFGLRTLAAAIDIPKPKVLQISQDIVADRASFIAQRNFDINREMYDFKHDVPKAEREIKKLGYVIQGDATPEQVGLSEAAVKWLPKIKEWTKGQDEVLKEAYGDSINLLDAEHYLTQVWDMDASRKAWAAAKGDAAPSLQATGDAYRSRVTRTLMHDPYLKQRTINSYKTGIEQLNMVPRYDDVADILKRRADFATQAIANRRFAGWLRDLGVVVTESEAQDLKLDHWKQAVEAPALNRVTYAGNTKEGMPYFERRPVYIHPDFEMAANAVFGKGVDFPGFATIDAIRALGKRMAFTFSMFHHFALSEQGHAIYTTRKPLPGIGKTPPGVRAGDAVRQTFAVNPHWLSGVKSGIWEAVGRQGDRPPVMRMDPEVVRDAIGNGLHLNSEEREGWLLEKMESLASSQNRFLRTVAKPAKAAASVMEIHDSALWDFYHQGMMLDAYHTIMADELPKLGASPTDHQKSELGRTTAKHVNNAFGGLSFEEMLVSPKARQALNFLLIAPAWTLSNLRVLTAGFENEAGARITKKYIAGGAISWFMSTQALNYALSGHYNTEDRNGKKGPHFTWDNPGPPAQIAGGYLSDLSENAVNVSAGYNKDGSQRYMLLGKGFREPFLWMLNPIEMLGNKLSLPIRWAIVQVSGHAPGSGFEEIDPRAGRLEQIGQRAWATAESMGIPFVAREAVQGGAHALFPDSVKAPMASSQILSFPTKRGMTLATAIKAYTEAANAGREDKKAEVLAQAAINRIDPHKIINTYKSDRRKKQRQVQGPLVEYDAFGNPVRK